MTFHYEITNQNNRTMAELKEHKINDAAKPRQNQTAKETEIVAEFCHLLEESRQLFKSLR